MSSPMEMPWRPAYEFYAAVAWISSLLLLLIGAVTANLPTGPFWYMAAVAILFFSINMRAAWNIWSIKFALSGVGIDFLDINVLKKKLSKRPDKVWLGYGFDWKVAHTQRIYELKKNEPSDFYPPEGFLRAKEFISGKKIASIDEDSIGAPWIHGVEPDEKELDMAIDNLIGNTLIVGTTRCGKTRLLDVLFSQFIFRKNDSIFIFDPKGDMELRENMRRAAKAAGREKNFHTFHLGFPAKSIRIDPLKNYVQLSELASRVAALVPSDSGDGDSFTAFAWGVANAIFMGMIETGEKPTLLLLRQYVENGIDPLLTRCLPAYFTRMEREVPGWEKTVKIYISRAIRRNPDGSMPDRDATAKESLNGHLMMYDAVYKTNGRRCEAIEALTSIYNHPADHMAKMLANFKPALSMLTSGEMAGVLSPDVSDIDDERLSTDLASLADSGAIVYIGLNALANKTVAGAVGSMFLSDMAAYAALRYNFRSEQQNKEHRVYLGVDEAAQLVNDPYIQMLNMSGGAGFVNLAATQTISDFAARLGSEDKARVMLGNFNNLIALRSKDRTTQDFITESFGESYVATKQTTQGTNSSTEQNIAHYGGTISERVSETLEAKFPPELLGMLPNWQYIASISGGRLIKGRVPILSGGK